MKHGTRKGIFWITLFLLVSAVCGSMAWLAWHHFVATDQKSAAVSDPNTTSLEVPSTIMVLVVCSYAIDRVLRGLLFLLQLWPAWRSRFPDPTRLPDPAKQENELAVAEAWKNRDRAVARQKMAYFLPAFLAGLFLATLGHIRVLQFLDVKFPHEEFTGGLVNIVLTALVLMGGADQTSQILGMFGAKVAAPRDQREGKPIELTGNLILEGPAGTLLAGGGAKAKVAEASGS